MPPTIRIRIVAAVDQSLQNVFVPLMTASKRAGATIGANLGAGAALGEGPYRSMPAKIGEPLAQAARAGKQFQDTMGSVADGARQKFEQLGTELRGMPTELRAVTSVVQSELAKIERMKAREMLGIGPRSGAMYTGSGVSMAGVGRVGTRLGAGALHFGTRLASDMLQGMGINTDLASMFSTNQQLETTATNVSNFGYIPGAGPNGQRVASSELIGDAHKVAQETGNQATDVLEGLEKSVGLTGDLDTGRKAMKDLAVLSKATGSNLAEMVEAAGNVSNVLGNVPDKGKAVYDVMRAVAGEGKTGAVLIKDLAVQMAKVAAGAQMFTGDRGTNIAILGALAQEARGRGGAASASQAATSVSSFVNTFSKGTRLRTFKGFGVDVQGSGGLRDARDIIIDSFSAAMHGGAMFTPEGKRRELAGGEKNFSQNVGAMFADVRARSAVRGFESIYREQYAAGHGDEKAKEAAAAAAVRAEFERLTSASMSQELVMEDFRIAMATSKSKAEVFNDELTDVAGNVRDQLLPAVLELAPAALGAAKGLADLLAATFGRPGEKEVEASNKDFNSLEPFWTAVHGGNAGPGMHFDPTQGDLERAPGDVMLRGGKGKFNAVTGEIDSDTPLGGNVGKTGMWVPDVTTIPQGGQEFVAKKRDEAQQELERQRKLYEEKKERLRRVFREQNHDKPGTEAWTQDTAEANLAISDPLRLRTLAEGTGQKANVAEDIIAARGGIGRAEGALEHVQEIADKLAEGIAKNVIQVVVMNPEELRPKAPGTAPNVGDGQPGVNMSPRSE